MNLDHLKAFYYAANRRNFSQAAKALRLTQPSVSLQIQQLEEALQVRLFERTTRSIKLTEPGRILLRHAEQIFQSISRAELDLYMYANSVKGDLSIGASTTIGEHALPYHLGSYRLKYPQVNIVMRIGNSDSVVQQLAQGEIDFGFVEKPVYDAKLLSQPFMEDELVAIAAAGELPYLQQGAYLTPEDCLTVPLVLREQGSGTRRVIEDGFRSIGIDPGELNVIMELGNTEAVKASVETGLGISILSRSAIRKELQLGLLRVVPMKGLNLTRYFHMISMKHKVLSPTASDCMGYLLEAFGHEREEDRTR